MNELQIILDVCESNFEIDLRKKTRVRDWVFKRAIFYKICRQLLPQHTLKSISNIIGNDHSTVIHGINLFDKEICGYDFYYNLHKKCFEESKVQLSRKNQFFLTHISTVEVKDLMSSIKEIMNDVKYIQGKIQVLRKNLDNNTLIQ